MSTELLTLPLSVGGYPFSLSAAEQQLRNDDWAWLFLRLNPLYRHDYTLFSQRNTTLATCEAAKKLILRIRVADRPNQPPTDYGHGKVARPRSIPTAILDLDSRYFRWNGEPISGALEGLRYKPMTLRVWLGETETLSKLAQLELRELDAPRDYGIGAWVDPDKSTLDRLTPAGSWFFHINEPIWSAGTWALREGKPVFHNAEAGQSAQIGSEELREVRTVSVSKEPDFLPERVKLVPGSPLPQTDQISRSSELTFLICLDGYVEPQLAEVRRIADRLKLLHKTYYPQSVKRGALPAFEPSIIDIDCASENHTSTARGLVAQLRSGMTRNRKNWRAARIDVAAPLVTQFEYLKDLLSKEQKSLGDKLTFPIRNRTGRGQKAGHSDNWLKKALCAVELHVNSQQAGERRISQEIMAKAFFDPTEDLFWKLRKQPIPESHSKPDLSGSPLRDPDTALDSAREALEVGQKIVLGWYEFISTPAKPSPAPKKRKLKTLARVKSKK